MQQRILLKCLAHFFPLSILSIPIFVYYLFIYLFLLVFSTNQTENIII